MIALYFEIPGEPVPAGRPRVFLRGKHVRAITPEKTTDYERHAGLFALQARQRSKTWRTDWAAYGVTLNVFRTVARGDADNLAKSLIDGVAHVLFGNDRAVTCLQVEIHEVFAEPRVTVEVAMLGDLTAEEARVQRRKVMAKGRRLRSPA